MDRWRREADVAATTRNTMMKVDLETPVQDDTAAALLITNCLPACRAPELLLWMLAWVSLLIPAAVGMAVSYEAVEGLASGRPWRSDALLCLVIGMQFMFTACALAAFLIGSRPLTSHAATKAPPGFHVMRRDASAWGTDAILCVDRPESDGMGGGGSVRRRRHSHR
jgi:hypothetical protein